MDAIVRERQALKNDKINLQYYKEQMKLTIDRCQMECEDYRSRFLQQMQKLNQKKEELEK